MKRTLSVATLLGLVATVASAATVTSQNTVGYKTLSIKGGGFNMLAVNWDEVGGGDKSIQDLFDTSTLTGGQAALDADNLLVWDDATAQYTTYFLYDSGGTYPSWDGKWVDENVLYASATFANGSTFWLTTKGANTSLTIAGEVPTEASVDTTIYPGFNMIGSSYAADLPLNFGIDVSGSGTGGQASLDADNLLVWDNATSQYTTYFLYDSGGTYPSWDGHWVTDSVQWADASIPLGGAAWYTSKGAGNITWTETKPY
jgi:hypothetical protein